MGHIGLKASLTLMIVVLVMSWSVEKGLAATGAFTVISSPNKGTSNNQLFGVAATSASDAWSVSTRLHASFMLTVFRWCRRI